MEEKTGFVRRAMAVRKAASQVRSLAQTLQSYPDETVSAQASRILEAVQAFEE